MKPREEKHSLALLQTISQESLLPQLITQLNKDAFLAGVELHLQQEFGPAEIVKALSGLLEELLQNDFNAYLNFLYRVDIPEKRMLVHEQQSMEELVQHATLQVLSREWEKVWFKNKNR